jgi:hypothetical protein
MKLVHGASNGSGVLKVLEMVRQYRRAASAEIALFRQERANNN